MEPPHLLIWHKDILREVLQWFEPPRGPTGELFPEERQFQWQEHRDTGRGTLACSARVCKTFCDTSLDILWKTLPEPFPLLELLPGVQKVRRTNDQSSPLVYILTGVITPDSAEWARFRTYAKRVRHLKVNMDRDAQKIAPVWNHLSWFSQGEPLLPNLSTLKWVQASAELSMLVFFWPSLQEVIIESSTRDRSVHITEPDYTMRVILSALVSKVPSLSRLELRRSSHPSSLVPSIADFVGLRYLYLDIPLVDGSDLVLHNVGSLKNLRSLSVEFNTSKNPSMASRPDGFLALEELTLLGPLPIVTSFLGKVESRELRTIDISLTLLPSTEPARVQQLENCFVKFSHCLESLTISYTGPVFFEASMTEFLRPLDHLRRLRHLRINLSTRVTLGAPDTDILQLCKAWPDLETFELHASVASHSISILVSAAIAASWPHLNTFRLPRLDTRGLATVKLETVPPLSHRLKIFTCEQLDRIYGTSDEIIWLALYLDHFFPNLKPNSMLSQGHAQWVSLFRNVLSALQLARKHERMRQH